MAKACTTWSAGMIDVHREIQKTDSELTMLRQQAAGLTQEQQKVFTVLHQHNEAMAAMFKAWKGEEIEIKKKKYSFDDVMSATADQVTVAVVAVVMFWHAGKCVNLALLVVVVVVVVVVAD